MRIWALRVLVGLLGLIAVVTGIRSILVGLDPVIAAPNAGAVELDNNLRFLSAIWAAIGVALWTCVRDPIARLPALRVLVWLIFAGGVGRIAAFIVHGLPAVSYLAITASELLAPLLLLMARGPTTAGRQTSQVP